MPNIKRIDHKQHFLALDLLRGMAAICVMLFHAFLTTAPGALAHAYLAVDFFFMLSGFVVSYAYEERLISNKISLYEYILRRVIRLYPMLTVGVLISSAFMVLVQHNLIHCLMEIVPGILDLPVLFRREGSITPLDPSAWSIFFEMFVSVLFGVFVSKLRDAVLWLSVGLAGTAFICVSVATGHQNLGAFTFKFWGGFPRVIFTFGMGVGLQRLNLNRRLSLPAWAVWPLGAVLVATFIPGASFRVPLAYDLFNIIFAYPIIIMLASVCIRPTGRSFIQIMKLSGDLSYPVYIIHYSIFLWLSFAAVWPIFSRRSFGIAECAISMLAAWLLLRLYDEPCRSWLERVVIPKVMSIGGDAQKSQESAIA